MITLFYDITFLLSIVLSLGYILIWHKHFDVHITLIFALVPLDCMAYPLLARSGTLESAFMANRLSYISACFLMLIIMLT